MVAVIQNVSDGTSLRCTELDDGSIVPPPSMRAQVQAGYVSSPYPEGVARDSADHRFPDRRDLSRCINVPAAGSTPYQ